MSTLLTPTHAKPNQRLTSVNSLALRDINGILDRVIYNQILVTDNWGISC